ncbi:MAG: ATP-binding protein [Chloroflexi bacterium]|nr:MAG: ATP-binding protein [Chloroflexota bacterium]
MANDLKALTVHGNLDSLELITNYVLKAAKLAHLNPKDAYRLRLAIDEIATNIITHGYTEAGISGKLTIQGYVKINKVVIQLEDSGQSFNPSQISCSKEVTVSPETSLKEEGGLGIFLALSSVDHFHYERLPSLNRSTFVIYLRRNNS